MKTRKELAIKLHELAERQLHAIGRLMTPEEVALAMRDRSQMEKDEVRGWAVCGEMHHAMWKVCQFSGENFASSIQVFEVEDAPGYAVIIQECGNWQHRILLPLLGKTVSRFIDSLQRGLMRFSIANNKTNYALQIPLSVDPKVHEELVNAKQEEVDTPLTRLIDMLHLSVLLSEPSYLKPLKAPSIEHVCVTLIIPPEIRELMELLSIGMNVYAQRH